MNCCGTCGWFERSIEPALPGLFALSSDHASVRDEDGLCVTHDRLVRWNAGCKVWVLAKR